MQGVPFLTVLCVLKYERPPTMGALAFVFVALARACLDVESMAVVRWTVDGRAVGKKGRRKISLTR